MKSILATLVLLGNLFGQFADNLDIQGRKIIYWSIAGMPTGFESNIRSSVTSALKDIGLEPKEFHSDVIPSRKEILQTENYYIDVGFNIITDDDELYNGMIFLKFYRIFHENNKKYLTIAWYGQIPTTGFAPNFERNLSKLLDRFKIAFLKEN